MHTRLLVRSKSILILFVAALFLAVSVPFTRIANAAGGQRLQQDFAAAATEFDVPKELLLSISYNQSRWEDHDGQVSASGGYGVMHLTTAVAAQDGRGSASKLAQRRIAEKPRFTLDDAAKQLNVPKSQFMTNTRQNIRGAAALLAKYAQQHGDAETLTDWYDAVVAVSGIAQKDLAEEFADNVYASIRQGVSLTTTEGQLITLTAKPDVFPSKKAQNANLELFADDVSQTECPSTITCRFVPARFAQNNPTNPADYGNYDTANRPKDMKIKYIVIHDTEGSYESSIAWFQDPRSYVAAHYVIRSSDGEVTQMLPTKDVGWHAGNWYMNMHSIGIEHEGFAAEGATWYTEAMYRSSAKLVRYLADKYDIPLDREHIVGHEQYHGLTPARAKLMHNDPGPFWNWEHYMDLLHAKPIRWQPHGNAVAITPRFAANKQTVSQCDTANVCTDLPEQSANFVYLRTAPRNDASLLTDAGLHPDGQAGTIDIDDWSAVATYGQRYAVAGRQGDWTAIWFGGQRGWFYNPRSWEDRTALSVKAALVKPKAGLDTVPVYGRPVPEATAFDGTDVPPLTLVPLQYKLFAGQSYVAYDRKAINDYYHVSTFDRSAPGDGELVVGGERYIPIEYNHRQAFVRASDVVIAR
jgi:N-acetyl-anhydromuramyl-L-alanine amidase AmpD